MYALDLIKAQIQVALGHEFALSQKDIKPFGHAIEYTERYQWRHGSAVSVGMVFAAELARSGKLGTLDRIEVGLPSVSIRPGADPDGDPPQWLDYDAWIGPAPSISSQKSREIGCCGSETASTSWRFQIPAS